MSLTKNLLSIAALAITLATAAPALAQTPAATGTVRHADTNGAWMTFEAFTDSNNAFGFFLRFKESNGNVMTVAPFATEADGSLSFWFIEYSLIGAADPNGTQGWQWVEVAGGRMNLSPATATDTSIDGTISWTWQKVAYTRVDTLNPVVSPVRLTVP